MCIHVSVASFLFWPFFFWLLQNICFIFVWPRQQVFGFLICPVYVILEAMCLLLHLLGFLHLGQIISQVMTVIKPWQVVCSAETVLICWPFMRRQSNRVNILIYSVLGMFYGKGGAHAGHEDPYFFIPHWSLNIESSKSAWMNFRNEHQCGTLTRG